MVKKTPKQVAGIKVSKIKSKFETAGLSDSEQKSFMQMRLNDRRVDRYINQYINLIQKGSSPSDARKKIMNEIKTLKIPIGQLNVRS